MRFELKHRVLAACLAFSGTAFAAGAMSPASITQAGAVAFAAGAVAVPATVPGLTDVGPVPFEPVDSGLPADWHRNAVFQEILVRAYQDSNGDGIGDINGLISRLDYLKSLGITGLWLMPVFRSSDHDHGYAVENYREIEPDYGTLEDFDRLIAEAHKRGIGIIVDYVMNHSSSDHKMFEASMKPNSPYRDMYIWAKPHPEGWTTFSGDPWREQGDSSYYAAFDTSMPDFNLRNPKAVEFHMNNLRFWLNRGVDGFRFDAVGVLYENGSIAWDNQPENHVLMGQVRKLLDQYGKRYMVCEAPSDPVPFAENGSCGSAFAFGLQKHIVHSVKMGRVMPDLLYTLKTFPIERMGTILSNHDWFAGARPWRQFNGDVKTYKMAAATLLTLPGIPFIYYGEEIGLGLSEESYHDDQKIRGPMAWDGNKPLGGFTDSDSAFRAVVQNWKTNNVAAEDKNPDSLLNWYRGLIHLRNAEHALSVGTMKPISGPDEQIFAFEREHEGTKLLVLLNYAYREGVLDLPAGFKAEQWQPVFPASGKLNVQPKKVKKGEAPVQQLHMGTQEVLILKAVK